MSVFLPEHSQPRSMGEWLDLFIGFILGLGFLKFATPSNLSEMVDNPNGFFEIVFLSWPLGWGYFLYGVVFILAILTRLRYLSFSVILIPLLIWFGWNVIASFSTIDAELTRKTMMHFLVLMFTWVAGFLVARSPHRVPFLFIGMTACFLIALTNGFHQKFWGFEETRQFIYSQPDWQNRYPPEFLYRIERDRIFSTLTYPNSFAALIILVGPLVSLSSFHALRCITNSGIGIMFGISTCIFSSVCLFWSGSKAGYLIYLTQIAMIGLFVLPLSKTKKIGLTSILLIGGIAFFSIQYGDYFKEGARSLTEGRFGYWRAAQANFLENPVTGSGPGTFFRVYQKTIKPDEEMARLVHNDYLQQASDAGAPTAIAYILLIGSSLWFGWKRFSKSVDKNLTYYYLIALWVGFFGWSIHSLLEWTLYIPAIAQAAFFMGSYLVGSGYHRINAHPTTS